MLMQDLRYAIRYCGRRPAFALLLVLTVALGIGATTAVFSVVDALMLRPPPFRDAHRLAELWQRGSDGTAMDGLGPPAADVWRDNASLFARMEAYTVLNALLVGDEPTRGDVALVTPGLIDMLGVAPAYGRLFTPEDVAPDAPEVVLLSHDVWRTHFGSRREIIGSTARLNERLVTVIGVMPAEFKFPLGGVDLWMPWRSNSVPEAIANEVRTNLVVRLRDGVPPPVVQARLDAVARRLNQEMPRANDAVWNVSLRLLAQPALNRDVRTAVWVLAGAVLCVLLITCANAANLMLVNASVRRHELAVRNALGATRGRLIRQLLLEALLLSAASGGLGVLLALWGVEAITALVPEDILRSSHTPIAVESRVLLFAIGLTLLTGLVFGTGPALRATREGVAGAGARRPTAGREQRRLRDGLIVVEVAASIVLLAGAGLLVNSYVRLLNVDLGIDADRVLGVEIYLPAERHPDPNERDAFFRRLQERLWALPGVRSVTIATGLPPGSGFYSGTMIEAEGAAAPLASQPELLPDLGVDSAYFRTLGIPIVRGRSFDARDTEGSPPVAIIDPTLAAALWPGESPLGRRFRIGPRRRWLTVVGVAGDVRVMGQDDRYGSFEIYTAESQEGGGAAYRAIGLRTDGDPAALITDVKRVVWEIDPAQPIELIAPLAASFSDELARPRFLLALMGAFAAAAVLLAMVGIYAVVSYAVTQRTHEIGIRMALGAQRGDVVRDVVGGGIVLASLGAGVGLLVAAGVTPFMRTILYGVEPLDAPTFAAVTVVLLMVAVLGCLAPATRASRISPMAALRSE